ncbi:MAG: hypothetical protein ABIJ96_09605 [Elusimicrobiota bacterium]
MRYFFLTALLGLFGAAQAEPDLSLPARPAGLTIEGDPNGPVDDEPAASAQAGDMKGGIPASGPVAKPIPLPQELYDKVHRHVLKHCEHEPASGLCCLGGTVPLPDDHRSVSGCMGIRDLTEEGDIHKAVLRREIMSFSIGLRETPAEHPESEQVLFFHMSGDGKLNFVESQTFVPMAEPKIEMLPPDSAMVERWKGAAKVLLLVLPQKEI